MPSAGTRRVSPVRLLIVGRKGLRRGNPGPGNGGKWRRRPGGSKCTVPGGQPSAETQRAGPTAPRSRRARRRRYLGKGAPPQPLRPLSADIPLGARRSPRWRLDEAPIPPHLFPLDSRGCASTGPWCCCVRGRGTL